MSGKILKALYFAAFRPAGGELQAGVLLNQQLSAVDCCWASSRCAVLLEDQQENPCQSLVFNFYPYKSIG
ncbi:hypothetical protein NRB16_20170 [Pseudomonas sp. LJDD11]|uniref:hypothetical protein n=1 Tax=Pseudomonas sp. LJDD11 TaxID=2931984 RepID=UPI00211B8017|nr:hypothetical protein [Pseudomonas sp. LJDD11]MCQ9425835.1 hypothetical protein [Pseudomonas sp. LJDD11]